MFVFFHYVFSYVLSHARTLYTYSHHDTSVLYIQANKVSSILIFYRYSRVPVNKGKRSRTTLTGRDVPEFDRPISGVSV